MLAASSIWKTAAMWRRTTALEVTAASERKALATCGARKTRTTVHPAVYTPATADGDARGSERQVVAIGADRLAGEDRRRLGRWRRPAGTRTG